MWHWSHRVCPKWILFCHSCRHSCYGGNRDRMVLIWRGMPLLDSSRLHSHCDSLHWGRSSIYARRRTWIHVPYFPGTQMAALRESVSLNEYQYLEHIVDGVGVLSHQGVQWVIFMVQFMILVYEGHLMANSMPPIHQEVLSIIDKYELSSHLPSEWAYWYIDGKSVNLTCTLVMAMSITGVMMTYFINTFLIYLFLMDGQFFLSHGLDRV